MRRKWQLSIKLSYAASLSVKKTYLLPFFTNIAFTCSVTSLQLIRDLLAMKKH